MKDLRKSVVNAPSVHCLLSIRESSLGRIRSRVSASFTNRLGPRIREILEPRLFWASYTRGLGSALIDMPGLKEEEEEEET